MRVFQVETFYTDYLNGFYPNGETSTLNYADQIDRLMLGGFAAGHMITPYLPALGHDTFTSIANCQQTQLTWLMENATKKQIAALRSYKDILALQIETVRPDILYATDPTFCDSALIAGLSWRPPLCIGWRAAPTHASVDFSAYDLMLTSDDCFRAICEACGAKRVETFFPGHPAWVNNVLGPREITYDVVFSGQAGPLHQKRRADLAKILPSLAAEGVRVGLFSPNEFPEYPSLQALKQDAVFGMDMYRVLRGARMALNILIDSASPNGINMRDFETTGVGSLLIDSGASENLIFDHGTQCFCLETAEETVSGILNLLDKPDILDKVAEAGHRFCMKEYEMNVRARRFMAICEEALNRLR